MKIIQSFITLSLLFVASTYASAQTFAESRALPVFAEINASSPSITLRWKKSAEAQSYKINKRSLNASSWGNSIVTLTSSDSSYTDNDVTVGEVYEYRILKTTNRLDPFTGGNTIGYGYVSASIKRPAVHDRGTMWVLVAKNIKDSLQAEITQLMTDLGADGWNVYEETINEAARVSDVKALIDNMKSSIGCDAVYLLGHIPVPYSGVYCKTQSPPDGHGANDPNSHCGAWVADVYYGDDNGTWTDTDSTTLAKRPANDNLIGDGKFDNESIPGTVTIAVGRVDFWGMTNFAKSEIQLTKQYLNKAHDFKVATTQVIKKGIVEDNFGVYTEGFGSGALRDFTAIAGEDGIVSDDIFNTAENNDYLMAYASGAGSYTSCSGVGTTNDFKTKNAAAFNHIFGSFFGDYDIENNFMRSSMATEKLGLVCIWSGRPKWVTHTLAIGETYGDITVRTQNSFNDYEINNRFQRQTHIALLGDPSLRNDMLYPASNISLMANSENTEVDITWDASTEPGIDGYHVYRSHKPNGKYVLLNTAPVTSTSFKDENPYKGTNHYMVRVAKETTTGSGSYINLSLGVSAEINNLNGEKAGSNNLSTSSTKVYPTLAIDILNIERSNAKEVSFSITNNLGAVVSKSTTNEKLSRIDITALSQGSYFITIDNKTYRFIKI